MWTGFLGFGLVTIPVKTFAATERKALHFNQLHSVCATPIRYRKWCPACDQDVSPEDLSWGYEYEKGHYVILDERDFEVGRPKKDRTIEITDFVSLNEIDPIYFDKTYFLQPERGAAKAYDLLVKVMRDTGRIALAKVVLRTKESLAVVRVYPEGVLAMETMFFPEEIRSAHGLVSTASRPPEEREIKMAMLLVDSMTTKFEPGRYRDEYRMAMEDLIRRKAEGEELVTPMKPETEKIVDLMEALKRSVEMAESARS